MRAATATEEATVDWDDVRPKPRAQVVVGEDLKAHSIADLRGRIAACESEIERVRKEIAAREAHEAAASRLFKK